MPTVVITGGTGLIGRSLSNMLVEKGYRVIILSRSSGKQMGNITYLQWDVENGTIDRKAIEDADYIIHLAGAGVADKKWTEERKQEIISSRTLSAGLLVKSLTEIPNHVKTVISASAVGWYGDDKKLPKKHNGFHEDMPPADDFLGSTCREWEASIAPVEKSGKRLVILRTGIVLSSEGGALPEFIKPVKFGIAGFLGSGKQVVSWIHIEDLCRLYINAIENEAMHGIYNAVAPSPVTNKELTLEIATRLRGRFYVPIHVPAFIIKAMLGGMSIEVLKSTTVSSDKIKATGFQFIYPTIDAALSELVK